jgi:hypothetical protein
MAAGMEHASEDVSRRISVLREQRTELETAERIYNETSAAFNRRVAEEKELKAANKRLQARPGVSKAALASQSFIRAGSGSGTFNQAGAPSFVVQSTST